MEAAHRKSKRVKLAIHDEYMHAAALKFLLQSGEYEMETQEWSKLPYDQQNWTAWKATIWESYVAKIRSKATQEGEENPFGGSAVFGGSAEKTTNDLPRRRRNTTSAVN